MTLARELARRALATPTGSDVERLRALTLANVVAGAGRLGAVGELIEALPLDRDRPGDAAFVHAMRLHARTQDDFHPAGRVHVGAVTLAASLALADAAGTRLLECLAAGYEAMCIVANAYSGESQRRGYRPTGVFGPIGAAVSAAVALRLDEDGVANAVGLAAARSGGTNQSWLSGTDEWVLEVGAAARAGVEAALFTQAGAVAAPEAFEGAAGWARAFFDNPGATRLRERLAKPGTYVGGVAVKPYPVSGIAQVPTELGCRAHAQLNGHRLRWAVLRLSEPEVAYPGSGNRGPFQSRSDALMSVGFCVACGIADGAVLLERLEHPNDLADLVASVRLEGDSSLGEGEAVLELDLDGQRRDLAGDSRSLLYPSWSSLAADGPGLAARSEADPGLVDRAIADLGADYPDALRVHALTRGAR